MSRDGLPSWFDAWLTTDPALEQPDPEICRHCDEAMEWEEDGDESGPTGSWRCVNKECPGTTPGDEQKGGVL